MAIQFSSSVRDARLDSIETTIGASPLLRIYSGTMPADTATAATISWCNISSTIPANIMTSISR